MNETSGNSNRKRRRGLLAAALIALTVGMACALSVSSAGPTTAPTPSVPLGADTSTAVATQAADTSPTSGAATEAATAASAVAGSDNLIVAVRQVAQADKPAVVQITNEQVQMDQYNQPYSVPTGVGSGVIYDSQGHILTNDHVIAGAQSLLVSLTDGRAFTATLVGEDPQTDLAVIQIKGSKLPVAQLGDSSQLQVGDWVVAIGNALALPGGPTVTAGVASALGRTVQEPGDPNNPNSTNGPFLFDVIQTSAPINPGNSGGPLVDLSGRVVGIDTLVAGQAEPGVPAQGIGFAIAINTAKPIADQLVANGHVNHPFLGISYVTLNPAIAAQLGTQLTEGVVVAAVASGSPAEKAGLQPKDVITSIDGKALHGDSDLAQAINLHKPGDALAMTVQRGSQTLNITATLATMPTS
jgi:S1-C subfamily serine protease